MGLAWFRGDPTNLIKRFFDCAAQFLIEPENSTTIIVRVCGDQPFIDPGLLDYGLGAVDIKDDIACSHDGLTPTIPYGISLEAFRMPLLNRAHSIMGHLPTEYREHLFPAIWLMAQSYRQVFTDKVFVERYALDTLQDYVKLITREPDHNWRRGIQLYSRSLSNRFPGTCHQTWRWR
jgi:spore coat polysaccharide biosynthesis protein SpsF (cytidylyltransferase family)